LLFARYRFVDVVIALRIDKANGIVLIGKAFVPVRFVLKNSPLKVVRQADVEGSPGAALQNVDVEAMFTHHASDSARTRQSNAVLTITLKL
jgi:hypothetical protein